MSNLLPEILLDSRMGSRELFTYLSPPVSLTRLEYGDAGFFTPHGYSIGIERKTLRDFLGSMSSGRLSGHQVPGLQHAYTHPYIVIEGYWRVERESGVLWGSKGPVKLGSSPRRYHYSEVMGYLLTLDLVCGVRHEFTFDIHETAKLIESFRKWYSKPAHRSHLEKSRDSVVPLTRPSIVQRVAMELSGIDVVKAIEIAKHFPSVSDLVGAGLRDLREVAGIGKVLSQRIWEELREGVTRDT